MRFELSMEIRRSPKELWPWMTEVARMKRWMKGLVSIEPADMTDVRPGMHFQCTIQEGRRQAAYDEEILEWVPDRRILLSFKSMSTAWQGLELVVGYTLHDLGGSTRVDYECNARTTRLLWKILGPLCVVFARMQARSFLASLKKLAESEGAPTTA
jgi:uncharacterized protein YndB with AHSA1/START domain